MAAFAGKINRPMNREVKRSHLGALRSADVVCRNILTGNGKNGRPAILGLRVQTLSIEMKNW